MPINGFQLETPQSSAPISPTDSWVVQKFGGTSVGKFAVQIVDNVIRYAALRSILLPFALITTIAG